MANGIAHPAAPDAPAGVQETAGPEAAAAPPAPPPQDLGPTDKLLVAASPLVGAWGEERYGFSDARVLQVPRLLASACITPVRALPAGCEDTAWRRQSAPPCSLQPIMQHGQVRMYRRMHSCAQTLESLPASWFCKQIGNDVRASHLLCAGPGGVAGR